MKLPELLPFGEGVLAVVGLRGGKLAVSLLESEAESVASIYLLALPFSYEELQKIQLTNDTTALR